MTSIWNPCLVIGLGGTGQWVLTYLKRNLLLSNNSKIPPNIHLLAIDTYPEAGPSTSIRFYSQDKIELQPDNERFLIGKNIKEYIDGLPKMGQLSNYYPGLDLYKALQSQFIGLDRGAGASRVLGRLALLSEFVNGSRSTLYRLLQKRIDQLNHQVDGKDDLEIYLVFSLHGGTGAGIFADLVALLHFFAKEKNRQICCRALVVLPEAMQGRKEDQARAYATWRELDRWMNLRQTRPVVFSLSPSGELQFQQDQPLFNECYLFGQPASSELIPQQYDTFPMLADFLSLRIDKIANAQLNYQATQYNKFDSGSTPAYHSSGIYAIKKRSASLQSASWAKLAIQVIQSLVHQSSDSIKLAQEHVNSWLDARWPWNFKAENLYKLIKPDGLEDITWNPKNHRKFNPLYLLNLAIVDTNIVQDIRQFDLDHFYSQITVNDTWRKPDEVADLLQNWFGISSVGQTTGLLPNHLITIGSKIRTQFIQSLGEHLADILNTWHSGTGLDGTGVLPFLNEFLGRLSEYISNVHQQTSIFILPDWEVLLQKSYHDLVFTYTMKSVGDEIKQQDAEAVEHLYIAFYRASLASMVGNWANESLRSIQALKREVEDWIEMVGGESRSGNPSLLKQLQAVIEYSAIQSNLEARIISSEIHPTSDDVAFPESIIFEALNGIGWEVEIGAECELTLFLNNKDKDLVIYPDFKNKTAAKKSSQNLKTITNWVLQTLTSWKTNPFPRSFLEKLSGSDLDELIKKSASRITYIQTYQPNRLNYICYPIAGSLAITQLHDQLGTRGLPKEIRIGNPNWLAWFTQERNIDIDFTQERINARAEYLQRSISLLLSPDPILQPIYRQEINALYWENRLGVTTSTHALFGQAITELLEDNQYFILFVKAMLCDFITYEVGWGYALTLPNQAIRIQLSSAEADKSKLFSAAVGRLADFLDAVYTFTSRGHDIRTDRSSNRIQYNDIEKEIARFEHNRTAWLISTLDSPISHSRLHLLESEINQANDLVAQRTFAEILAIIELICQDWKATLGREAESIPVRRVIQKIENYYVVGPPLTPEAGRLFVGRKEIFEQIRDTWNNPYRKQSVVLHGQRRMGKTSVLYQIKNHLGDEYITVMVDFQGFAAEIEGERDLWLGLAARIHDELSVSGLVDDTILPVSQVVSTSLFKNFLSSVEKRLKEDYRLVLMFDEYEKIPELIDQKRIPPTFVDYLRSMIQASRRTLVILAGHHELQDELRRYYSPLMNVAQNIRISYLDEYEAEELVLKPWDGFQLEYEPGVVHQLIQACGGQPMLIQLVCSRIVNLINKQLREKGAQTQPTASMDDLLFILNEIIQRSNDDASPYFEAIEDWLGTKKYQVVVKIARHYLNESLKDGIGRDSFSDDDLNNLDDLVRKDILKEENGQFRFRIDLLRRWINRQVYV